MSQQATMAARLAVKTPEAAFLRVLTEEFNFSSRVSAELLNVAREMLVGAAPRRALQPGQIRLVVTSRKAPFGPPLAAAEKVTVQLTVDSGAEDAQVRAEQGGEALRQGRILRLLDEALEQGGVLTQEDLAKALGVSRRTIARDVKVLNAAGHWVPTRGKVKGVGRGQTHKVRILALWLDRQGYDKIARWVHHSPQAIKRYVGTFKRVVLLKEQGLSVKEIAFLTKSSARLVREYLELYAQAQQNPGRQEKLAEELARVRGRGGLGAEKGGLPV